MRLHIRGYLSLILSVCFILSAFSFPVFAADTIPEIVMESEIDSSSKTITLSVSIDKIKGCSSAAVFIGYSPDEVKFVSASDPEDGMACASEVYTEDSVVSAALMSTDVFDKDSQELGKYVFSVLDGVTDVTFKVLTQKPYLTRAFDKDENQILINGYEKKAFSGCFHFEREIIPGYASTCVKAGLSDGEKCTKCGEITVVQKEIPALGHTEENGFCTVCGERIVTVKPTVKDSSGYAVDYDKKTVILMPKKTSALSVYEFRSNFNEDLTFAPDAVTVKNALKFTCGDEYTVILKGDVNSDGGITAADARIILRMSAKLETPDEVQKSAADINSDGKVTSSEARTVLRFSAKLTGAMLDEK